MCTFTFFKYTWQASFIYFILPEYMGACSVRVNNKESKGASLKQLSDLTDLDWTEVWNARHHDLES